MGKNETEASLEAFRKLKVQGQSQPPALISDGWGGIRIERAKPAPLGLVRSR